VLSPDGRGIALVPAGQVEAVVADVDSGNPVTKFGYTNVRDFSFGPPELLVRVWSNAAKGVQGRTMLMTFDANAGAKRSEVVLHEGQSLMHRSGLFADRKQVAVAHGKEDVIDVWDVTTGQRVRQVPAVGPTPNLDWPELFASSDGSRFAASREMHLVFWDGTTGAVVADLPDPLPVTTVAFIPGRDVFVFRPTKPVRPNADKEVAAFDVRSQTYVAVFAGQPPEVTAIAASADSKWLAVGDKSGQVRLWDLKQLP
jgi:WD40 repeat protein